MERRPELQQGRQRPATMPESCMRKKMRHLPICTAQLALAFRTTFCEESESRFYYFQAPDASSISASILSELSLFYLEMHKAAILALDLELHHLSVALLHSLELGETLRNVVLELEHLSTFGNRGHGSSVRCPSYLALLQEHIVAVRESCQIFNIVSRFDAFNS